MGRSKGNKGGGKGGKAGKGQGKQGKGSGSNTGAWANQQETRICHWSKQKGHVIKDCRLKAAGKPRVDLRGAGALEEGDYHEALTGEVKPLGQLTMGSFEICGETDGAQPAEFVKIQNQANPSTPSFHRDCGQHDNDLLARDEYESCEADEDLDADDYHIADVRAHSQDCRCGQEHPDEPIRRITRAIMPRFRRM